jgi:hypothetical protein
MRITNLLALVPVLGLAACVTASPRPAEFAVAREKIDAAEAAFAREDPRSRHYLELANQELGHARAAFQEDDVAAARSWAKQAAVNADMAQDIVSENREPLQDWELAERRDKQLPRRLPPASRSLPSSP